MVIYGYEQDELESIRFRDAWSDEQNRIYATLNGKDRSDLIKIYSQITDRLYSSNNFVNKIAWRIYTEACMNQTERFEPNKYNGEAFKKFINDETHYAIERTQKVGLAKVFLDESAFEDIRYKVLTGLVKKAIEFFSGSIDKGNLRCDLKTYIEF